MNRLAPLALSALAALAPGCLSNPTPHPQRDAQATTGENPVDDVTDGAFGDTFAPASDAAPGDADGDASADSADTPDAPDTVTPDGAAFPPPERTVFLRDVIVTDLDGDGFDDVLLTNAPDAASEDWGVFVMFGRAERSGLATSDAFVATRPRPDQVLPVRLMAGAAQTSWELAVFGATGPGADAAGWLELHPYGAGGFGPPLRRETTAPQFEFKPQGGTEDAGQPVLLARVDVPGSDLDQLLVGDLYNLVVMHPSSWSAEGFGPGDHTTLRPDPTWDAIIDVQPMPGDDGAWLAVMQQNMTVRFVPITASGPSLADEESLDLGTQQAVRGNVPADFDGDGRNELASVSAGEIGVYSFDPPLADYFVLTPALAAPDGFLDDIAVGDIDGSGKDDIVVVDREPDGMQSGLYLLRDPSFKDGQLVLLTSIAQRTLGIGQRPRHLAVGHFRAGPSGDAPPDIWMFEADGTPSCARWSAGEDKLVDCGAGGQ